MLLQNVTLKNHDMKNDPIVVEQTFNTGIEKVWQALTDKDEMRKWYFDLSEFKPEAGFEFQFAGQGHKGEKYIHLCKITQVIPQKKLQYSWKYENYDGNSLVTFELFEEGERTRLRLTHEGLETFPQSPDFARESFNAGWTELITKSLPEYLKTV